jgi:deoxyribose-phosphate aldolase
MAAVGSFESTGTVTPDPEPAGGIRTLADAALDIGLVREILGDEAVTPTRVRIGASGLLEDIEALRAAARAHAPAAPIDPSRAGGRRA